MTQESLGSIIGHIAGVIGSDRFPTGERAALRRMTPNLFLPVSFFRFALHHLPREWDRSLSSRNNWTTLVAGIALMSPDAHRPDQSLGAALGKGEYAESRLERLLSAEEGVRRVLLLRVARFLNAKRLPFNWLDGALLLLLQEPDKREALYRRIAGDYYRALPESSD